MSTREGPRVALFLHSTGTGPALWARFPEAALRGRRAVLPAHVGYPPGEPLPRGRSCDVRDDVARVLAAVPADARAVDVVAHSYGGLVAAKLAPALGARLRSLCLYEPVFFGALARAGELDPAAAAEARSFAEHPWFLTDEARGGTDEWLAHFIDYWNRPGSYARMPEAMQASLRALGWKMFCEVRSCFFDPQGFDDLALDAPVTLLVGQRSPAASRAMAKAVGLANPRATVRVLEGLGHMAPVTHATQVFSAVAAHFAALDAASERTG